MMARVLVIRPGALGDALLAFPILQMLQSRSPRDEITLVTNAQVLPLALNWQIAATVSDYASARWSQLFFPANAPRETSDPVAEGFQRAICWLRDPEGVVAANLSKSGVKEVLIAPGRPAEEERTHIVDYLARSANLPAPPLDRALAGISPPVITQASPIALHPGSGGTRKCWPIDHFAAVIEELWLRGLPVLLLAGPADHERLSALLSRLPLPPRGLLTQMIDAPLLSLVEQLQCCRGYLGNDSGITHLAAMIGLPTLALFGPSDPVIWHPIGPAVHILRHEPLEMLFPAQVLSNMVSLFL